MKKNKSFKTYWAEITRKHEKAKKDIDTNRAIDFDCYRVIALDNLEDGYLGCPDVWDAMLSDGLSHATVRDFIASLNAEFSATWGVKEDVLYAQKSVKEDRTDDAYRLSDRELEKISRKFDPGRIEQSPKDTRLIVRLPTELMEAIRRKAKGNGITISWLIRRTMEKTLKDYLNT